MPPMLMPSYPRKLVDVATASDSETADLAYVQLLQILDPLSFEPRFAGVPFFLTHLGLVGTNVPKALNNYP